MIVLDEQLQGLGLEDAIGRTHDLLVLHQLVLPLGRAGRFAALADLAHRFSTAFCARSSSAQKI